MHRPLVLAQHAFHLPKSVCHSRATRRRIGRGEATAGAPSPRARERDTAPFVPRLLPAALEGAQAPLDGLAGFGGIRGGTRTERYPQSSGLISRFARGSLITVGKRAPTRPRRSSQFGSAVFRTDRMTRMSIGILADIRRPNGTPSCSPGARRILHQPPCKRRSSTPRQSIASSRLSCRAGRTRCRASRAPTSQRRPGRSQERTGPSPGRNGDRRSGLC